MKRFSTTCALFLVASVLTGVTAAFAGDVSRPSPADYRRIAIETDANLQHEILDKWFPAAVDEQGGGFYENFGVDWTLAPGNAKSLVYQSRLTWTSAQAAHRYPEKAPLYLAMTKRGAAELMDKLWDKGNGGFYWTVNSSGQPVGQGRFGKQVYGIAFGIYSLAASYETTKDPAALDLAEKGFRWLDAHAHDNTNLGYYEVLNLDGSPAPEGASVVGAGSSQKIHEHLHSCAGSADRPLQNLARSRPQSPPSGNV